MADSDDEYIGEITDEEDIALQGSRGGPPVSRSKRRKQRGGAEWEVSRTWETLVEGADGTISSTVDGLLEAGKRKRLLRDTTPLQRGIIRHLILILDLSQSMLEKDLRPTRYLLTLRYAQEFVREFFEQNPISQLGVLGLNDGLAIRISDMSGNPTEHISAIQTLRTQDPKGLPSLQNGLEMARGALLEASWGADPLEYQGGFGNLAYNKKDAFNSALSANGTVKWRRIQADVLSSPSGQTKAILKVSFPEINWGYLQSIYGWFALQYQAWARGFLKVDKPNGQTIALFTDSLLEFSVDGTRYFGGDYYTYRKVPVILYLWPGFHVIDLRLIRDVRVLGALEKPTIEVVIEAETRDALIDIDETSLVISEFTQGRFGSPWASVHIQNNMADWVEILSVSSPDVIHLKLIRIGAKIRGIWSMLQVYGHPRMKRDGKTFIRYPYGRQLGAMGAILRSNGTFSICTCSKGVDHVALQISRNRLRYFAADSQLASKHNSTYTPFHNGNNDIGIGNVMTIAVGDDLPSSQHTGFPIRSAGGHLILFKDCIHNHTRQRTEIDMPLKQECREYHYKYENGLGALFLRPLEGERLELVIWGADISGLEHAARLVPILTGVGQPEFLILSDSCR
ncbi:hypothetical protein MW887_007840 [Aspergillus wentii]|nr:hypothetical protein MW887_007840 [Aspergillus wentii]